MRIGSSQTELVGDAQALLEALDRSPEQELMTLEHQNLTSALQNFKTLKARQEELTALRQESTQQLKAAMLHLKESVMRFRAAAKAKLGPRNERLVHFKVAPLRKRPRKSILVVKPRDGEASETLPGTPASPPAKPVA